MFWLIGCGVLAIAMGSPFAYIAGLGGIGHLDKLPPQKAKGEGKDNNQVIPLPTVP